MRHLIDDAACRADKEGRILDTMYRLRTTTTSNLCNRTRLDRLPRLYGPSQYLANTRGDLDGRSVVAHFFSSGATYFFLYYFFYFFS
jgi:hypothetical protein